LQPAESNPREFAGMPHHPKDFTEWASSLRRRFRGRQVARYGRQQRARGCAYQASACQSRKLWAMVFSVTRFCLAASKQSAARRSTVPGNLSSRRSRS